MSEMTSVTARSLYMVTDWDRKWWRDESWGVTGGQATKVQKWRAGVNCSRCDHRQPDNSELFVFLMKGLIVKECSTLCWYVCREYLILWRSNWH